MSALPAAFNFAQHMVPFSLHLPTFTPELEQGAEFASAYALGALGQILMPFVEEPKPYIPAQALQNVCAHQTWWQRALLAPRGHGARVPTLQEHVCMSLRRLRR